MEATVKAWMSGDPVAVEPEASALEALELMTDRGIRHLPVVDRERRVVGVLSADDLRAALPAGPGVALSPAQREAAREWRVADVMTHAPETVGEEASLEEASDRMADRRIGCLPVVDAARRLVGLLSETDLLRALATVLWSDRTRQRRVRNAELDELVSALRVERERITARLDTYHEVERRLSTERHEQPMDAPEAGADTREVHLVEALDAMAAGRLEAIDRALDHAAQGRLGVCDACGGAIPPTRLRALPGTTLCVACARAAEGPGEEEVPFERPPGGWAETGRPELGARVETRFGEGQLLRVAPFGTCPRCGDVEGSFDAERDAAVCGSEGCARLLDDVNERAVVAVGEREVYVDPAELRPVDPAPYD